MSEPNNQLIFNTLLDQNKSLGRIEATAKAVAEKLDGSISHTKTLENRLTRLEASHHRMKGASAVWALVISSLVSALGWYFSTGK